MAADHLYVHVLGLTAIEGVRLVTRLAMPLFIFIMGFLLKREQSRIRRRGFEVFLAALAVIPVDILLKRTFNILLPISVALVAGSFVAADFFVFGIFLHPFDFSILFVEYGIFSVMYIAALGYLKRKERNLELIAGIVLGIAVAFFELQYMLSYEFFVLPLVVAFFCAFEKTKLSFPVLETIGRYPLQFYIAHLYLVLLLSYLV